MLQLSFGVDRNGTFPATDVNGDFLAALQAGRKQFEYSQDQVKISIPLTRERMEQLASDNPIATSILFKETLEATIEELFGVRLFENTRSTPHPSSPAAMRKGAFGRARAVLAVTETGKKEALHEHALVWVDLNSEILTAAATEPIVRACVTKILDQYFTAQARLRAASLSSI